MAAGVDAESLEVRSRDGLALEAEFDRPAQPKAGVVLCHPHPQMGGTMNAPLIVAVRDGLVAAQWAVLRFNFRGVGNSEGEFGLGEEEVADALGAVDELRRRTPDLPLALGGWSFGAAVALRVLPQVDAAIACVAIAPAITPKQGVTAGAPDPGSVAGGPPILIICGANDDRVSPADCKHWAEAAGARYEELKGANHFFWARYDVVTKIVVDFLEDALRIATEEDRT
jgi:alpha/beta superfamily hydrolase